MKPQSLAAVAVGFPGHHFLGKRNRNNVNRDINSLLGSLSVL